MKQLIHIFAAAIIILGVSNCSEADSGSEVDYNKAAQAMCDKMKQCNAASMQESGATQADMSMMSDMMDQMCASMKQAYQATPGHSSYAQAAKCMQSLADLSCTAFSELGANSTKECRAYMGEAQ